eukprot:scaffold1954_cov268-Pinguiococcus_pyrenoidosus.AAC.216
MRGSNLLGHGTPPRCRRRDNDGRGTPLELAQDAFPKRRAALGRSPLLQLHFFPGNLAGSLADRPDRQSREKVLVEGHRWSVSDSNSESAFL